MASEAWLSLAVTLTVFATLLFRRGTPPDLLFVGGLLASIVLGVIKPADALAGFSNPAVLTIASLFIVAAALRFTGVLDWIGHRLLGRVTGERSALRKLALPVLGLSAIINNTPVVAMLVPLIIDWCRQRGVSPSRLLIPISYLAIMGGTCTLIGTSTNIIVNGLFHDERVSLLASGLSPLTAAQADAFIVGLRDMSFLEIGSVGLPCAILGTIYLLLMGQRMLPNRTELIEKLGDQRREYLVEMMVQADCRLIDQTVEQAGLRHLRGLFLIEIDRGGEVISPVAPEDIILQNDRLIFTGVVTTIVDLEKIPGLVPAADLTYEVSPRKRSHRLLAEAVISNSSPLLGRTIRQANFRKLYNAAVVAVHRNGHRLNNKVGDIRLEPGDTLLLQTRDQFVDAFQHSRDFYLVSTVDASQPRRHDRAVLSSALLALLVVLLGAVSWFGAASAWTAAVAMIVAAIMIVTRCLPHDQARRAIDLQILITIAAALGLGKALAGSGAADSMARGLVDAVGQGHPLLLLAATYVITLILTEMITNTAVAAIMFPLAVAIAQAEAVSPRPFVMAIALAASSSFITPVGYQTNLMVMGPGGYRPGDYLKAGFPLTCIFLIASMVLIPWVWPFAL
jgi:di/tricarboxylate transporter